MLVFINFVWCVCLLSLLHGSVKPSDNHKDTLKSDEFSSEGHFRQVRSTFGILPPSIRAILAAAYEVPTKSGKFRKFVKTGTQETARREFIALNPVFPAGRNFAYHGVVDDFNVLIRFKDKSQGYSPTLLVSDKNGGNGIKIVYKAIDEELRDLLSRTPRASGTPYSLN